MLVTRVVSRPRGANGSVGARVTLDLGTKAVASDPPMEKRVTLLDFPDNRFDSVDLLDVVKAVEEVKARVRPDVVYVQHWGDLNIDHRITFDAVMTAFRPLPGERAVSVYAYEVPSSTGWAAPSPAAAFVPTHFVDITGLLDKKVAAMESYVSERRVWPHPRAPEALQSLAKYRGSQVGVEAAEAFVTVRTVVPR